MRNAFLKNHQHEKQLIASRISIALVLIVILFCGLLGRLAFLQLHQSEFFQTLSTHNRIELVPIEPTRGLIYDRKGVLLAENIPVYSLDIIPDRIQHLEDTLEQLSRLIHITDEEIATLKHTLHQTKPYDEVPLKIKLSEKEVALFSVNKFRFPGVKIKARLIRHYPLGEDTAHVVGYVGRINAAEAKTIDATNYRTTNYLGKSGIEKYYEESLHGTVGFQHIEVDASGKLVRLLDTRPPISGNTLILSIDSQLQTIARKALGNHPGAVVALDPNTGEVLALASAPSFDPNLFVHGLTHVQYQALIHNDNQPLYNRAIHGLYAPGSTIKPFIGLQGLDQGFTSPEKTIQDKGYYELEHSKHLFHDWKVGGHGTVDLHKALVVSCDTYFYWLAYQMKIVNIDIILKAFGFGEKTGIDSPAEWQGILPSPEWKENKNGHPWYPGDTLNAGIGQGYMLVTPLQLGTATSILAMHGQHMQGHLHKDTLTPDNTQQATSLTEQPPVILQQNQAWGIVISAMQDVIQDSSGTGFRFGKDSTYTVAAKTGTAQVTSTKQSNAATPEKYRDNGLFIAFAPTDHPRIAVAVIAEHTGTLAPVVARKIMDAYLTPANSTEDEKHALSPST